MVSAGGLGLGLPGCQSSSWDTQGTQYTPAMRLEHGAQDPQVQASPGAVGFTLPWPTGNNPQRTRGRISATQPAALSGNASWNLSLIAGHPWHGMDRLPLVYTGPTQASSGIQDLNLWAWA